MSRSPDYRMALIKRMNADATPAKTLRDEYAMAALAGILANPGRIGGGFTQAAEVAFEYADAMLAFREADRS